MNYNVHVMTLNYLRDVQLGTLGMKRPIIQLFARHLINFMTWVSTSIIFHSSSSTISGAKKTIHVTPAVTGLGCFVNVQHTASYMVSTDLIIFIGCDINSRDGGSDRRCSGTHANVPLVISSELSNLLHLGSVLPYLNLYGMAGAHLTVFKARPAAC